MAQVFPGRYAAQSNEPFVVFLIGMRVNRLFALRSWIRVAKAMPPMIAELKRNPELGSVGIWHETYAVAPGQYETNYANMQRYGLGVAAEHVPVVGRLENARSRMT